MIICYTTFMSSNTVKKTEYEKYLESIQNNIVTPDDVIQSVVKEAIGTDIFKKYRIIAGEVNEVYRIVLVNNQELILRISRTPYPNFQQEKWAIEQVKAIGVPAPTILFIKYITVNGKECSFCLMEKIDGEVLERGNINFGLLSLSERQKYIQKAGNILSKIHSIKTKGFGYIIGDGKAQYETSEALIDQWLSESNQFYNIAKSTDIPEKIITSAIDLVSQLEGIYTQISPCLNHSDYGNKHFIVKNKKIVAIIDWGSIRSDSAIYDFASWDYWYGNYIPTKWLMEGYIDKKIFDSSFEDILHRIRIMKGIETINWYTKQKYSKEVQNAKIKLINDIEYFKKLTSIR